MNDESRNPDPATEPGAADSRRQFIRRMTYLAPVVTTYLLAETAYGKDDEDKEDHGRHRGRTSPKPRGHTPPPPSPSPP